MHRTTSGHACCSCVNERVLGLALRLNCMRKGRLDCLIQGQAMHRRGGWCKPTGSALRSTLRGRMSLT